MPNVIITYETIYEILRLEKTRVELQKLDPNFFENTLNYLKEKQSLLNSQKSKPELFEVNEVLKTQKQIENIKRMLKELYERRENKILQLATLASRSSDKSIPSLLEEEKELYKQVLKVLNSGRKNILNNLISLKQPQKPEIFQQETKSFKKQKLNKVIRFIQPVPKFLDTDLTELGPFEEEDIANLPLEIADLLIKKKRAIKI